jgi:asparagine synthase (glutamine-hydrolysing)
MCGVAGIYRRQRADEGDPARLRAMTEVLRHRGPDDHGYLHLRRHDGRAVRGRAGLAGVGADVLLGSRRLAVIDLSPAGWQPMANETGDVFVVFNGEIYNYVELRRELAAAGHVFTSATDTEVIVHAYEEWGDACVTRFNGMWAFALWDQRRARLLCSRDRFGIKPFYYFVDDRVVLFASEIKGILPALPSRPMPDDDVVVDYLVSGALCRSAATFFAGIRRLEPAHNLIVSRDGVRSERYWSYGAAAEPNDGGGDAGEAFRALLDDAVRLRLRSDVPVGVSLSGGLDSTAVLGLATAHAGRPLAAFSAAFPGFAYDESAYARIAAQHYGATHHVVAYDPGCLRDDLRRLIWHMDYPALQMQILPRWQIVDRARRHVKVMLEGQGADEILAGYLVRYFAPYVGDRLRAMRTGAVWQNAAAVGAAVGGMWRLNGLGAFVAAARPWWPLAARGLGAGDLASQAFTPELVRRARRPRAPIDAGPFPGRLDSLMYRDHSSFMLPHLLKMSDAISMAGSLEVRLPFMDHRLVEMMFRLPAHEKSSGHTGKLVLRRALAADVPPAILARRDKVGFVPPRSEWLRSAMDTVREVLLSDRARTRGLLNHRHLERLLREREHGRAALDLAVYRWLSVELWFELFIDA